MSGQVLGCVRVSTTDQNPARQVQAVGAVDETFTAHLPGAVAQLERSLIRERQREGIALARTRGTYRGRACRLDAEQIAQACRLFSAGVLKAEIACDRGARAGRSTPPWPALVPMLSRWVAGKETWCRWAITRIWQVPSSWSVVYRCSWR